MSGKRSYNMFDLISISELDAQSGVKLCAGKEQYFKRLDQFCTSAMELIGNYSSEDVRTKAYEVLENLFTLQGILISIQAFHLAWRVERLGSVIKSGDSAHISTLLATTQEQVRSLLKKVVSASMPYEDKPDGSLQCESEAAQKPHAPIKYDAFERIGLLIEKFELRQASIELSELMNFGYTPEIDEVLLAISNHLMSLDYVSASAECVRLLFLAKLSAAPHPDSEPGYKPEILAVDDLPDVLNTIKAMLKRHYNVYGMTNHETALRYLSSHTPDLILLDIEMPDMDGYTLLTIIKKMPAHKTTPIIFLTSNATDSHIRKAQELGASDFIKKPVDVGNLSSKIEYHIRRSRA